MTPLLQSPKRLAKLLASINVNHSERPLNPIEVSEEIRSMLTELNNNKSELLNRLPLSLDMIDAFLRILKLPPQIHDIVIWGNSNRGSGQISFSVAQQLGRLDDPKNILKFVNAFHMASKPITKEEIKSAISFKRHNPTKPIEDCITEITNVTRPIIVQDYIFISGINPSIVQLLKESSVKKNLTLNEHALVIISNVFPSDSILGIKINDDYVRIMLSEEGSKYMRSYADSNGLSKKDIINHIFRNCE